MHNSPRAVVAVDCVKLLLAIAQWSVYLYGILDLHAIKVIIVCTPLPSFITFKTLFG